MSLFGSLYVGTSGLQTGQNALNATAHNMSNIDTVGYTRQQILLGTRAYNTISVSASAVSIQQYGLGVNFSKIRQVRDYFLDRTYRQEAGRSAFYQTTSNALEGVEDLLQEMQGKDFAEALTKLWESVQELAKDPSSPVCQGVFVQRSGEFVQRAASVYTGLTEYQDNLNTQIKDKITKINEYGRTLNDLNEQIIKIECGGVESANDLRDQRNYILDEMSKLAKINYTEDVNGVVSVQIEGTDFLKDGVMNEIGLYSDPATGFYTPYWKKFASHSTGAGGRDIVNITGAEVFNLDNEISPDLNTDIGSVKSMLLARGDHRATYKDLQPDPRDSENIDYYKYKISPSLLMNMQAQFDQLIHGVVTAINQVIADASDSDRGYLIGDDGQPMQLFETIKDNGSGLTSTNIKINETLRKEPTRLVFQTKDGEADFGTTGKLKDAFTDEKYALNPTLQTKTNFVNYYNNLVSQVADTGSINREIVSAQEATVEATDNGRQQVVGVSSEEEMANMVMYQNAYNAASRYINVISQMLEHVINTLGR